MALALDATTLGQRFTVLCISVLVRGCAIPVAWKVLPYNQKGSWQPHWEGLLEALRGSIPAEWEVLVLADRGCMRCGCTRRSWRWAGTRSCASRLGGQGAAG